MKKFNILLLVMVLAVTLTGCISQSKASSEAVSSSSQGTATDAVLTRFDGQQTASGSCTRTSRCTSISGHPGADLV